MRITPLRRWRITNNGVRTPRYGDHSYLTAGHHFAINYVAGTWQIKPHIATRPMWEAAISTGVLSVNFPRRCDAVAALQLTMNEVDG